MVLQRAFTRLRTTKDGMCIGCCVSISARGLCICIGLTPGAPVDLAIVPDLHAALAAIVSDLHARSVMFLAIVPDLHAAFAAIVPDLHARNM